MVKNMAEAEKLYRVEFNCYTDSSHMTVSDYTGSAHIEMPLGGLIVPESKLAYYMKYGKGFKNITLVGSMYQGEV